MSKLQRIFSKTQWITRILSTMMVGLLTACNSGSNMKAEDFFNPDMTTLLKNIQRGDRFAAEQQLNNGLDLNVHGDEGITPLFLLLLKQDSTAVKLALELGADPNFTATDGAHPVPMMTGNDTIELLKLLLEYGGDANAVDRNGDPAIFDAIGMGAWDEIELLVNYEADLNKVNLAGKNSALDAASLNKFETVFRLINLGANYHQPSKGGATLANVLNRKLESDLINKNGTSYKWALKLKELLIEKGINFPPLSPPEVRERLAKELPIN
ncbi:ankyrin repeat domain-containing protein [Thalassotalea euphylliae]|nr:ankyrin repeat domain-containing protein [Thalassotalea euphylliae]